MMERTGLCIVDAGNTVAMGVGYHTSFCLLRTETSFYHLDDADVQCEKLQLFRDLEILSL